MAPTPRYRWVCALAQGGMAEVAMVVRRDGPALRWYARKRPLPELRDDAQARVMFLEEARLSALVRHPNVTSVVEVGEDAEGPFIVMELIEGLSVTNVAALLHARDEALPPQIALRIALGAARGLDAAHEARGPDGQPMGLVHRDVSPDNLLVGYDGIVRVTDLGIAKATAVGATTTTSVPGRAAYVAPERLKFQTVDRRADLYALGACLHELLAGAPAFAGDDPAQVARRVLSELPPDLAAIRGDLPAEIIELVAELLAKDPGSRPATAREVALRLEAALGALVAREGARDLGAFMEEQFGSTRRLERHALEQAVQRLGGPLVSRRPLVVGVVTMVVVGAAAVGWNARQRGDAPEGRPPPAAADRRLWAGASAACSPLGGGVRCWGRVAAPDGTGSVVDNAHRAVVPGIAGVRAMAIGPQHLCACDVAGRVLCWGDNSAGQLGRSAPAFAPEPLTLDELSGCHDVTVSGSRGCAIAGGRRVWCWGAGQPVAPVALPAPAMSVASSGDTACAVLMDGRVACWASRAPARPLPALADAAQMAMGRGFACALSRSGRVACWGANDQGQLGDGTSAPHAEPAELPGLRDVVQVVAGAAHACVRERAGGARCWGAGTDGQLGAGARAGSLGPVAVMGLEGVSWLAAGDAHTCAAHRFGLSCWGRNDTDQLGDHTRDTRAQPVSVAGFSW